MSMSPFKEGRVSLMSMATAASEDESLATMMEEDSVVSSPPRSHHSGSSRSRRSRLNMARKSPDGRRLFDDVHEFDLTPPSPPRPTVRPLNLDLNLGGPKSDAVGSTYQSFDLPPMHGRKRTSADRPGSPGKAFGADSMMQMSPHKSPNAFLTMDGRYVESKNPFSSPMMMDDDTVWASATAHAPGPSMPVSFYARDNDNPRLAPIPPRNRGLASSKRFPSPMMAMGDAALFSGFPDSRFSFTGSPIHEDLAKAPSANESLLKVRKLRMSDDVVAASEQHVASAYGLQNNNDYYNMTIDTKASPNDNGFEQDVSPTEVISFPPPTPVKARPNRSAYPSIRTQEPATPLVERRSAPSLSARTPHPGQYVNMNAADDETNKESKSRFFTDFDVIEIIGSGCFGTVYKVLSRLDGCMYAVKKGKRAARGAADRDRMLKEVRYRRCCGVFVFRVCSSSPLLSSYRCMHWQRYPIKPTRPRFILCGTIKLGWKTTFSLSKRSCVSQR